MSMNGGKKYTEDQDEADEALNLGDINKYEDAISKTGYGRFNYGLLLLCGWGMMSDSVELYSVSFILPPATCDLNLSSTDKGWINSSVFLGMMVGSYMWGILADRRGRRTTLLLSLTINGVGGLLSSLAQPLWAFTLCRFISGIGVGGSLPIFYTYYGEFQPKEKRGPNISVLAIFWPIGTIFAAGLAWFVIPYTFGIFTKPFTYNSWRVYLTLCTLPAITSAISLIWMPESPKYLMEKGMGEEALRVLRKIYQINNPTQDVAAYEVFDMNKTHSCKEPFSDDEKSPQTLKNQILELGMLSVEILRPPVLRNTLLLVSIFSTLCFGYYGLFLWLPELFKRVEILGGSPCLHEISKLNLTMVDTANVCFYNNTDTEIYSETFLTAISALPGNIITILLIDRIGRRAILGPSLIVSGLSVFLLYAVTAENGTLIISCIFSGFARCAFVCIDVLEVELFPTRLRSTGAGFMCAIGRIAAILGNTTFGALVDSNCVIPLSLVAAFMCIGGIMGLFVPDYGKRDIH